MQTSDLHRKSIVFAALMLVFVLSSSVAVDGAEEIVELPLQRAKCLCGVVLYPNDDPVGGAKIEELGKDWKGSLRSTYADSNGSFSFEPVRGRKLYFLQITAPASASGVNHLRVSVQVVHFRGPRRLRLILRLA
jgi:hypothetical protein